MDTTYDVRIYKTEVYRGSRVTTHKVRWKTGDKTWKRPFRTAAQADVFRAELLAAARKGEAFGLTTGEPVSWQRVQPGMTWYEFACAYVDSKWESASAKYRRAIAQALASATRAMLTDARGIPDDQILRGALVNWASTLSNVPWLQANLEMPWPGWRTTPRKSRSWLILL